MVEETLDRAVIIDLGIATTDPTAKQVQNRRYGYPGETADDLVSLGQLMYFLAVCRHIFYYTNSGNRNFKKEADGINDCKVRVYTRRSPALLDQYLEKVDANIPNTSTQEVIKALLNPNHSYLAIGEMFRRHAL